MADTKTFHSDGEKPSLRPTAALRILYGLERGKRFELVGSEFTIGRGEGTDIILADPTIADVHATLYISPTGARLRDAGSASGLRVNGRIIDDETSLKDGAQIEIGGVVLAFSFTPVKEPVLEAGEGASEPPPPLPPAPSRSDEPAWVQGAGSETAASNELGEEPTFTAAAGGGPSVRIDTVEKQIRQVGFRSRSVRRIRMGSKRPIVSQLVSWFVILTVAITAMWVIQTILYDSIRVPEIASPAVAASAQAGLDAQLRSAPKRSLSPAVERTPAVDYGVSYEASTVATPDKARGTYDKAMKAYWNDNADEALAILRELRRDHPDFEPSVGGSVDQLIIQVETQARYRDAVSLAATVAATQTATRVELKEALEGLTEIPSTDPRFGPVAELFRQGLQGRLDKLGGADADEILDEDPGGEETGEADDADDEEEDDDFDDDEDLAALALDEDGEVVEEPLSRIVDIATLMAEAREEARRLYEEGRYQDAARIYGLLRREDGLSRAQRDQCLYLERKLLLFGSNFEEGINLVEDSATAKQGIRRLETALTTDRVLFRFYERVLGKEIADANLVLAGDALDRGDLVAAGEYMERSLARDTSRPGLAEVKRRVAALAMDHLDGARAGLEADPVRTRRILKQIVAAAPTGSPPHEEASVLLEAMDRDGAPTTLPGKAAF